MTTAPAGTMDLRHHQAGLAQVSRQDIQPMLLDAPDDA